MESIGPDRVLEDIQVKEAREQIRSQKREVKEATAEARGSPLKRLVSYVELGGIILLIGVFKKPLTMLAKKLFNDVEKEVLVVDSVVRSAIATAEIAARTAVIQSYLLDPIQCYRFGGTIYNELIINGSWDSTIYAHLDQIPSEVDQTFVIGTGIGAINASSSIVRTISFQLVGMLDSMLLTGQNLN